MIILVRHGEATHHTQHLTGGWTDSSLTEKGRTQLETVGKVLARDFSGQACKLRILASDLKRALESAELLAAALGSREIVEPCGFLREKNNGEAAGLSETAARALYREMDEERSLDHRNYPGGETRREFFKRTLDGLRATSDWEKENLLIVAHKGSIQNLIFAWMGLDIEAVNRLNFSVDVLPASVTVLGINKWDEHAIFCLNNNLALQEAASYGIFNYKYGALDACRIK